MLSIADQIKLMKHNRSYGVTGRHAFGRGSERVDGTFSDERPRKGTSILEERYPLVTESDKSKKPKP